MTPTRLADSWSSRLLAAPPCESTDGRAGGASTSYNGDMRLQSLAGIVWTVLLVTAAAAAQTPQPFPRPGTQPAPAPAPAAPRPPAPPPTAAPPAARVDPATPTEATLGFPIYPGAQFVASYDAGRA